MVTSAAASDFAMIVAVCVFLCFVTLDAGKIWSASYIGLHRCLFGGNGQRCRKDMTLSFLLGFPPLYVDTLVFAF